MLEGRPNAPSEPSQISQDCENLTPFLVALAISTTVIAVTISLNGNLPGF
jgi:hypothetical protein